MQILARQLGSAEKACEDLNQARAEAEASEASSSSNSSGSSSNHDRPKFTLSELKEILQERNSLKARVSDLEDELSVFRPRSKK